MKEWLKKNWVALLGWGMLIVGDVILISTGIGSAEDVSKGLLLTDGIITAVGLLIAFLSGFLKKKE